MVRASFAGFSTALSAIQANQKRLDITGQNLANMNTPGYTRQALKVSSLNYTHPVSHYMNGSEIVVGFGVHMEKVTQIRDPYLDIQYRNQMQKSGYTDSMQEALDRLANVFDESQINGIRKAFDDIQSTLNNMADPSKNENAIYDSELRIRMQALTNLLNEASREIDTAEAEELAKLDGRNVNEQGSVERINDILQQIGTLNRQIKKNQIMGQQSLELMDERNVLLDELSSYIPIEVEYYKDPNHDGKNPDGTVNEKELYDYDGKGNKIGRKEWPDDLRVNMVYEETDANGITTKKTLTLVEGTVGSDDENYGRVEIGIFDDAGKFDSDPMKTAADPTNVGLIFHGSEKTLDPNGNETVGTAVDFKRELDTTANPPTATIKNQFATNSSSVQASLDMLWKDGKTTGINDVNGYEYYRNQLDNLAYSFAHVMNTLNIEGNRHNANSDDYFLLANKDVPGQTGLSGITAANIGINKEWTAGNVTIGTIAKNITSTNKDRDPNENGSKNETLLNMYEAMTGSYPYSNLIYSDGPNAGKPVFGNVDLKNNSFSDYMNYTSTVLANDSYKNTQLLKANMTVLNGIQNSRDSISGVSLDEEASNMMMYMSAYNAASRLMTTLDEALNTLISSTGIVGR